MDQGRRLVLPPGGCHHEGCRVNQRRRSALGRLRPEHVAVPDLVESEASNVAVRPHKPIQIGPTCQKIHCLSRPAEDQTESLIARGHGLARVGQCVLGVVELGPEDIPVPLLLQRVGSIVRKRVFIRGHAFDCDCHSTTPLLLPTVLFPTTLPRPVFFLGLATTNPYRANVTATTGVISDSESLRPHAHISPSGLCRPASTAADKTGWFGCRRPLPITAS